MQDNSPKPTTTAIKAIMLRSFGVQVGFSSKSSSTLNGVWMEGGQRLQGFLGLRVLGLRLRGGQGLFQLRRRGWYVKKLQASGRECRVIYRFCGGVPGSCDSYTGRLLSSHCKEAIT